MPQSLLKLGLSGNSEIEFFQNFLIYKGEKILYSDVDGIAYLYTRTRRRINFIPVGTSHSYYVSIKARGVAHKITFSSERNQDVFSKLANAVDVLIKPFVIVNLLLDFVKNNRLEIGGLTITPEGVSRKRTWRSEELLPWSQYHNAVVNQGKVSVFKKDDKGKYKLFGLPLTMSSTNVVILPDVLNFLFAKNGVLDEAARKQIIERKTQLSAMSAQDAIQDLTQAAPAQPDKVDSATSSAPVTKVKGMAKGWKITIGIIVLVFIALIVIGANSDSADNSTTNNSNNSVASQNQTSWSPSQLPLPTLPSQIPNYSGTQQAPPPQVDISVASSSESGSPFSSSDVAPYLTAVGELICNKNGQPYDTGSGSVWQFSGSSQTYVLTNYHVIKGDDSCTFAILSTGSDPTQGLYDLDISSPMEWNDGTDVALVPITGIDEAAATSSTSIADLNYSISTLPLCPTQMPQEAPVAVLGFPASTQNSGITFTVLNGVISGYDQSNPDAYEDYYTTAQVDNGNSGGVALSKYNDAICLLGIPTWVSIGEHQVEGEVQDINNIFYSGQ